MDTIDFESSIKDQGNRADESFVLFYMNEDMDGISEDAVWELINEIEDEKSNPPDHIPFLNEVCNLSFLILNTTHPQQKRILESYRLELLNKVNQRRKFEQRLLVTVIAGCAIVATLVWLFA
jgi:hypothetical protein